MIVKVVMILVIMAVLLASEPARDKIESVRIHKTFAMRHICENPMVKGKNISRRFLGDFFFVSHNAQNLVKLSRIEFFSSTTRR